MDCLNNKGELDNEQIFTSDNSAGNVKTARKLFSNMGFRLLAGTILVTAICAGAQYLIVNLLKTINYDLTRTIADSYTYTLIFSLAIQYLFAMPVLAFTISFKLPAKAPEKRRVGFGWFMVFFIISYSLMYCSNLVGTVINRFISSLCGGTISDADVVEYVMNSNIFVVAICTVVLAPIIEELIFRKLLVDRCGRYGEAASALVSALAFGLFHGNFSQMVYAFCIGYFLAIIYSKTGKIHITIGIHMIINLMGSVLAMILVKWTGIESYESLDFDNVDALMTYMQQNGIGILVMLFFDITVIHIIVAGIVLLIVNRKKFLPKPGEIRLQRHSTFPVVVGNVGMILFIIVSLAYIVYTFITGLS